jgi:hypothetical protein
MTQEQQVHRTLRLQRAFNEPASGYDLSLILTEITTPEEVAGQPKQAASEREFVVAQGRKTNISTTMSWPVDATRYPEEFIHELSWFYDVLRLGDSHNYPDSRAHLVVSVEGETRDRNRHIDTLLGPNPKLLQTEWRTGRVTQVDVHTAPFEFGLKGTGIWSPHRGFIYVTSGIRDISLPVAALMARTTR